MPAFDLSSAGQQKLGRCDVVGRHATGSSRFVEHVGVHKADDCEVSYDQVVDVAHMGPPLQSDGKMNAHVAGQVPLTAGEISRMEAWFEKIEDEYQPVVSQRRKQYIIHPLWEDCRDPNTGVRRYRRFSCAGFVLDAYLQVDVQLLQIAEPELPEVDKQTLASAYPEAFQNPRLLQPFGIEGDGPWRVVLAGYVLHSLNRTEEEIRQETYRAQSGDECF